MNHHCATVEAPRLGRKLRITLIAFAAVFAASFLPALAPLNAAIVEYLGIIWWAVLLGLLIGGLIDYFVPTELIRNLLGSGRPTSLLWAVLAGFLMSACSHGILAIAIQLYRKGASVPAVITFLLASPWANFPVTILLFSFFGGRAVYIVAGAMAIALTTGFVFSLLGRAGWIEGSLDAGNPEAITWGRFQDFSFSAAVRGTWAGAVSLANMVLWWIIIGFMIAAVIKAYVPAHWFMQFMGPEFTGLLVTLAVATVIEVCSEGSAPIAFEVHAQVGTLGNPFVFLMAGVVTDYTEIGLLWTNIGRRTALWLPAVAVPQVLLLGWLFNQL